MIGWAAVTWPSGSGPAYGGWLPVFAVASAAVIVGLQARSPLRRALGAAPLAALGAISYGVYLYHWPVYVVLDAERTGLPPLPLFVLRITVTLTLAVVLVPRPRAPDPRPAPALAPGDPDRGGRLRLDRHRRRHRAGRHDPVLDALGDREATAATLAPVDSELRPLAAVSTTSTTATPTTGAPTTSAAAPTTEPATTTTTSTVVPPDDGDPGPADRPVAARADHGRR